MSRTSKSRKVDPLPAAKLTVDMPDTGRRYTEEEKHQLLANLDIEVAHKLRQFEAWLADALENFRIHQEGLILRIPKPVRGMTMREFEKYGGDVQAALKGLQREKLGGGPETADVDKLTRKRKWVASQEADAEASGSGQSRLDSESSRAVKNARLADDAQKAKPGSSTGPGTAQRARMQHPGTNQTPQASRTLTRVPSIAGSPSPQKIKPTFGTFGRPPPRPASPSKPGQSSNISTPRQTKPPSSATFNPVLDPKIPLYPNPRLPRLNESMLSLNGSPLANPYGVNVAWFTPDGPDNNAGHDHDENGVRRKTRDKKGKSSGNESGRANGIFVRRDPSFATTTNGVDSHPDPQVQASKSNSRTKPGSNPHPLFPTTPKPPSRSGSHTGLPPAALVSIPTKDGHLLEFDPLQTSPGALDALDGITASAKKQAKEDVGRLVQAAVDKWKIK